MPLGIVTMKVTILCGAFRHCDYDITILRDVLRVVTMKITILWGAFRNCDYESYYPLGCL